MKNYDHKKIEKKWQAEWDKKKIYQAKDVSKKSKFYGLIEFPYPSGAGMHVGHIRSNTAMDIISRKRRMEGYNVLYPIGWDAFGLPTENYAIKTGIQPAVVTKQNTDIFRKQLKAVGFSFDWSREINTTDPKYYKWTQWIFLQLLKKGLAYKDKMLINWCPKDKTGLANEEVLNGCCERCGTQVEKKEKEQWMLAITKYAERLDKDLDTVDYLPQIKLAQRNWIGKSEGAEMEFNIVASPEKSFSKTAPSEAKGQGTHTFSKNSFPILQETVKVFTTRPDTIFGATYLVLSPEHHLVEKITTKEQKNYVIDYVTKAKAKSELERTTNEKEKTGVFTGAYAINPATKEKIPVWVADYVLSGYGTGAIMAVPAHDDRDFAFAKKYNLLIKQVIAPVVRVIDNSHKDAVKDGVEWKDRDAVMCIVKHWEKDEYLCQEWKDFSGVRSMISGGIESNENVVDAGRREILEESGYKNLKFIKQLGGFSYVEFYHQRKKTNTRARFRYLHFELENGEQDKILEIEDKQHSIIWKKPEELLNFLTILEKERVWELFNGKEEVFIGEGYLINSGKFDGMDSEKAQKEIIKFVGGEKRTTFKLRDWVFSRQRYWGEPIPVIKCEDCGYVPVPEKDLPVELPKVKNYQPTDNGESPLANISKWVNVKCPKCKGKAKRETDTMPNWAGSSWYYLRYTDPKNSKAFADKKNLKYWLRTSLGTPTTKNLVVGVPSGGVDWYNGGNEHTTLHLLYSRFWHKFLYDLKLVPTNEPYMKRTSHGMILGEGGVKMSKSIGNVINPDDIVKIYGADTLRIYEMFMGPFDQSVAWSTESIVGSRRFIEKIWKLRQKVSNKISDNSISKVLNKTIKKVSEDIEGMYFNTAISTMMILATEMQKANAVSKKDFKIFLQVLSPFAPHVTEELWESLGEKKSINLSLWPKWDDKLLVDEEVKIVVQINGKVRTELLIKADEEEESVKSKALGSEVVLKYTKDKDIQRIIYVKNRLINIVLV